MAIEKLSVGSLINIRNQNQIKDIEKQIDEKITLSYKFTKVIRFEPYYPVEIFVKDKIQQMYEKAGWRVFVQYNSVTGQIIFHLS